LRQNTLLLATIIKFFNMKRVFLIVIVVFFISSCKKECHEEAGTIQTQEVAVSEFHSLIANEGIALIIKEEATRKVLIETGENRFKHVTAIVKEGVLELKANAACPLMPSLEPVKIYVSTPNLIRLRNSSEYTVHSDGVLRFPHLRLFSENYQNDYTNFGGFDVQIENDKIQVVSNGLSIIKIKGTTSHLELSYHAGIGLFKGSELVAENVRVYHKGENKLEVNPQVSLSGDLYSTGNLISYNRPENVSVTEHFKGKLIFR